MSDYLTRLIERSLSSAPQIEPLIAPLHSPSDQVLNEKVESSEFDAIPAARIETAEADPPPGAAITAQAAGPPPSRTRSQHHQASIPIPESSREFPAGKEDEPIQARPKTRLRQRSSPRRPIEPTAASLDRPPSPSTAPVASVPPETIEQLDRPLSPTAAPLASVQPKTVKRLDRSPSPIAASVASVQPETIEQLNRSSAIAAPVASVQPKTIEQLNRSPSPIAAPAASVQPEIIEQLDPSQESVRLLRPTATRSQPKSQIIVQPEIKPATAPSVLARQALSKEPPAIHVTIGRIEVRAVHPPPEPVRRRPAPPSPKISLEEYLKQRNGGAR